MSREITKQAENKVCIVGKLIEATFNSGNKDGKEYQRVIYKVRVNQSYEGHEEHSDIVVSNFAYPFTSFGKKNTIYDNIESMKGLLTAQNAGIDSADRVCIYNGELEENAYVDRSGSLKSTRNIRSAFCSRAQDDANDIASFRVELFIMNMNDEVDSEGVETGRLLIKGAVVRYGGKIDVLDFIVEDPTKADFIRRNYEVNQTGSFVGRIRDTVKTVEGNNTATSSWGETLPDAGGSTVVHELIITGGADEPYDEEFAYDATDIRKAFNVRKARLEQKLEDSKKTSTATKPRLEGWE